MPAAKNIPTKTLPTFPHLCRLYPRLRQLAAEADSYEEAGHSRRWCANRVWYGEGRREDSLRNRTVVIANRAVTRFGEQQLYDVIYDGIYSRLPDCGECGCFNREALNS